MIVESSGCRGRGISIVTRLGKVKDDKKLQTEGKFDKAKGSAHNVAGDIKDAVKQSNK